MEAPAAGASIGEGQKGARPARVDSPLAAGVIDGTKRAIGVRHIHARDGDGGGRTGLGALALYLDFVNLFTLPASVHRQPARVNAESATMSAQQTSGPAHGGPPFR